MNSMLTIAVLSALCAVSLAGIVGGPVVVGHTGSAAVTYHIDNQRTANSIGLAGLAGPLGLGYGGLAVAPAAALGVVPAGIAVGPAGLAVGPAGLALGGYGLGKTIYG